MNTHQCLKMHSRVNKNNGINEFKWQMHELKLPQSLQGIHLNYLWYRHFSFEPNVSGDGIRTLYNYGLVNDAKELDAKIKCNTFHRRNRGNRRWFNDDDDDGTSVTLLSISVFAQFREHSTLR